MPPQFQPNQSFFRRYHRPLCSNFTIIFPAEASAGAAYTKGAAHRQRLAYNKIPSPSNPLPLNRPGISAVKATLLNAPFPPSLFSRYRSGGIRQTLFAYRSFIKIDSLSHLPLLLLIPFHARPCHGASLPAMRRTKIIDVIVSLCCVPETCRCMVHFLTDWIAVDKRTVNPFIERTLYVHINSRHLFHP